MSLRNTLVSCLTLTSTLSFAGGTYSPDRAVDYARLWAYDWNRAYTVFENDCTNFVSQTMAAGGLTHDKSYYSTKPWWHIGNYTPYLLTEHIGNWYVFSGGSPSPTTHSLTWVRAQELNNRMKAGYDGWKYISSHSLSLGLPARIPVNYGDVITVEHSPTTNGTQINHVVIVTGFRSAYYNYEPLLTYHSNNNRDLPFNTFKQRTLSTNPNAKIYIFRRSSSLVTPSAYQIR